MKRLNKIMILMAAALLLPLVALAAVTGSINGSVKSASGPVSGAKIMVDSSGDSSYNAFATTAADGTFTVADAPVGVVRVKVYNKQGKMVGSAKGVLKNQGDVVALTLTVAP